MFGIAWKLKARCGDLRTEVRRRARPETYQVIRRPSTMSASMGPKTSDYARLIRTALAEAHGFPATILVLVAFDGLRHRTPPPFVRDADP